MTHRQWWGALTTVAAALALLAGGLQDVVGAMRHVVGADFIWLSRDYVWMTPLANVLLFLAAAVPLGLCGSLWGTARHLPLAAGLFATLGALTLTLLIPGLHHFAALAVAIGIGTRVGGWVGREPLPRIRALGRAATGVAVIIAVVALAREAWHRRQVDAGVSSLGAARPDAPNVLVIILDTVRAASMSFLGYPRETTPRLAALAAEGAVFEQAWSTAPWTLPSHAGMFTGRYPSQLSTNWRDPLDGSVPTLAEALAARGYRTAGFAANHFYTSYESGLTRGFLEYQDYRRTPKQVLLSSTLTQTNLFWSLLHGNGVLPRLRDLVRLDLRLQTMWTSDRKLATHVTDEFLSWQAAATGRPFLAFLNMYDAHLPYDPPPGFAERFASEPSELDRYDGGIAFMDEALGAMFDTLRVRGVLDNTLVIISSDHGEGFGEHGLHGHGNSLYRPELHVPLIVRFPSRVPAGARVSAPVTLRDMAATALDAAGPSSSAPALPGSSWLAMLQGGEGSAVVSEVSAGVNTEPHHPVSRGAMRSLVTDSLHYIRNGDGVEELYRWREDPGEATDRARDSVAAGWIARVRDLVARALR
ncbi:MAG: sulfatase [Gemmatimonadetes bacterium]|nr:sulfatase [Gemmatimonadota bacterium]